MIDPCPHCGVELDDGDIYEHFLAKHDGDKRRAAEIADCYGGKGKRFNRRIGQYDIYLDRTVGYRCPDCEGEVEAPKQ